MMAPKICISLPNNQINARENVKKKWMIKKMMVYCNVITTLHNFIIQCISTDTHSVVRSPYSISTFIAYLNGSHILNSFDHLSLLQWHTQKMSKTLNIFELRHEQIPWNSFSSPRRVGVFVCCCCCCFLSWSDELKEYAADGTWFNLKNYECSLHIQHLDFVNKPCQQNYKLWN